MFPLIWRLALAATFLVLLASCSRPSEASKSPSDAPPVVGVITVRTEPVPLTSELPGRTTPYRMSAVRPQVTGLILAQLYRQGANVRRGDPLYQIDPAPFQAAFDSAKAALKHAEANAVTLALKAQRYGELAKVNAISRQEVDDAVAAASQAEADVDAAKAQLEAARINLANTRVTAPISGRAGPSAVTAGALVTAYQSDPLTTVQTLDPIYVDITQSSVELLRLRREFGGGPSAGETHVKLFLEDGTQYALEGELSVSDVTVQPTTGAVTLRAVFRNPDNILLPGMFVRAVIGEATAKNAVLVPEASVTRDEEGRASVFIVGFDNKVKARAVEAPRTVGDLWLVTRGLRAGDRLIVEGTQKVADGMTVEPAPARTSLIAATKLAP